jgi:hypothetical protein
VGSAPSGSLNKIQSASIWELTTFFFKMKSKKKKKKNTNKHPKKSERSLSFI